MRTGVVILAAGKGTRMKSDLPKVLHEVCGRTLLGWALAEAGAVDPDVVVVVVGHGAEAVAASCPPDVATVVQEPQLGTGHAVQIALGAIPDDIDRVVVLPGDMPLITAESLGALVSHHEGSGSGATVMSVVLDDPTGYGRIVRDGGAVVSIVEHRDATDEQRGIGEVNTSVYVFDRHLLADVIDRISADNDQHEYYLPDTIGLLVEAGHRVVALAVAPAEGLGVNDHAQLAAAGVILRDRINEAHMVAGVSIVDPARTYIDASVSVAPGAVVLPDTHLLGATTVDTGARVGPGVHAVDSSIGSGSVVRYSVLDGAVVGPSVSVGPYAYLRPGATLGEGSKAGTFVEIKGSVVGRNSKVPHLSYIGDADIGEDTNIGAATVTANYDGFRKHRTRIGDRVKIGVDTMLVAPVTVGDDAFTGAGSVITTNVPDGSLAVARGDQRTIDGYAEKRRKRAEEEAE